VILLIVINMVTITHGRFDNDQTRHVEHHREFNINHSHYSTKIILHADIVGLFIVVMCLVGCDDYTYCDVQR